jgi:hypothetical protein
MLNITVKLIRYVEDASRLVALASKVSLSRKPLRELLGVIIPHSCPKCGRRFQDEIDRLEFAPLEEVV